MTIYQGHDFSDYDWRYWADKRREEAERRLRDNRCICIWQPGDNARCPVHGIAREVAPEGWDMDVSDSGHKITIRKKG